MQKLIPAIALVCALGTAGVCAQDSSAASKSAKARTPMSTPMPVATPIPRKPSFFERLFGSRRATPKPSAAATPVPKPVASTTPRPKPRPKPAAVAQKPKSGQETPVKPDRTDKTESPKPSQDVVARTEPPDKAPDPAPNSTPPPAPAATPAQKKTAAIKTPTKTVGKKTGAADKVVPPTSDDPEVQEKFRYEQARTKALAEPDIQELKRKSDDATTEDEAQKASRAYNRALFSRMRKLEPGIKDRIDRMEAAMMRKLGDQP